MAVEYLTAAETLSNQPSVSRTAWGLVAAQTLESALKAYIARVEPRNATALNDPAIHHNLERLWSMAAKASKRNSILGTLTIAEEPPEWRVWLNHWHDEPYRSRLPTDDAQMFPLSQRKQLAANLRALVTEVEAAAEGPASDL